MIFFTLLFILGWIIRTRRLSDLSEVQEKRPILETGDLAEFYQGVQDDFDKNIDTRSVHTGIIVYVDKRCSDGELTYTTLCEDGRIRFFIMEEAARLISRL